MNDRENDDAIRVKKLKDIFDKTLKEEPVEDAQTKKERLEAEIIEQEARERNIRLDIMSKLNNVQIKYLYYIRCYLSLIVIIILWSGFQVDKEQGHTLIYTYSLSPYVVGVFIVTSFTALGTFLAIFLKWVYRTDRKEKDK